MKEMNLRIEGDLDKKQIQGYIKEEVGNFQVVFRATRLADLPK